MSNQMPRSRSPSGARYGQTGPPALQMPQSRSPPPSRPRPVPIRQPLGPLPTSTSTMGRGRSPTAQRYQTGALGPLPTVPQPLARDDLSPTTQRYSSTGPSSASRSNPRYESSRPEFDQPRGPYGYDRTPQRPASPVRAYPEPVVKRMPENWESQHRVQKVSLVLHEHLSLKSSSEIQDSVSRKFCFE